MLARLRDPRDPATAERVDPTNLAATFGSGVRLVRVTAQITNDPLAPTTIENKLPWSSHAARHYRQYPRAETRLLGRVNSNDRRFLPTMVVPRL